MTYKEFTESMSDAEPHAGMDFSLQALWYDHRGNWNKAHELVQDEDGKAAARIHAYLHRKEGDHFNADYWYRRAGMARPKISLEEEWEQIVREFLH